MISLGIVRAYSSESVFKVAVVNENSRYLRLHSIL